MFQKDVELIEPARSRQVTDFKRIISYPVYSLSEELDPDALIEMDRQAEKLASSLFFRGPRSTLHVLNAHTNFACRFERSRLMACVPPQEAATRWARARSAGRTRVPITS